MRDRRELERIMVNILARDISRASVDEKRAFLSVIWWPEVEAGSIDTYKLKEETVNMFVSHVRYDIITAIKGQPDEPWPGFVRAWMEAMQLDDDELESWIERHLYD